MLRDRAVCALQQLFCFVFCFFFVFSFIIIIIIIPRESGAFKSMTARSFNSLSGVVVKLDSLFFFC